MYINQLFHIIAFTSHSDSFAVTPHRPGNGCAGDATLFKHQPENVTAGKR